LKPPLPIIGLLYAGEMGASVASALRERGHSVVSTAAGRSKRTAARCRHAGVDVLDSVEDVARAANIVLSVVPPDAAEDVAEAYSSIAHLSPPKALYVDVNSISPERAASFARRIGQAGRDFVDASIHGQARNLTNGATLYLAGARAAEVADLFDGVLRTRVFSTTPGDASAMKMLLGGLSKGLCALLLEVAVLADRREMLGDLLLESKTFYPAILSAVERMLPTYPEHGERRVGELRELEATAGASGQRPFMITAARRLLEAMSAIDFGSKIDTSNWDIAALSAHLCKNDFLTSSKTPAESAPNATKGEHV
jgi:3-hydroxyisobutyrate dehydrogenase-like beta-hydroxyacid dehydrogenase